MNKYVPAFLFACAGTFTAHAAILVSYDSNANPANNATTSTGWISATVSTGSASSNVARAVPITDDGGTSLGSFGHLLFDIAPSLRTGSLPGAFYEEIDAVQNPEPTSALLGGIGLLILLRGRRG